MSILGGRSPFVGSEIILALSRVSPGNYLHHCCEMIESLYIIQVKSVVQPLRLQTCEVNSFLVKVLVEVGSSNVELRASFVEYYSIG
jgi:hypothetical protein